MIILPEERALEEWKRRMEDGVEMDGSSAERGVVSSTQHLLWTTYTVLPEQILTTNTSKTQ